MHDTGDGEDGERESDASRLVVVTGLSGSGISTAINALEDVGTSGDNLPPPLCEMMQLARSTRKFGPLAIGLDARNVGNIHRTLQLLDAIKSEGGHRDDFLEAAPEVLRRRFDVSRRPHPLARLDLDLIDAIRRNQYDAAFA